KANSNRAILRLVQGLGAGADVVSGGELFRALRAGFDGEDIVFGGVGKTERELAEALEAGVLLLNIESERELELIDEIAGRRRMPNEPRRRSDDPRHRLAALYRHWRWARSSLRQRGTAGPCEICAFRAAAGCGEWAATHHGARAIRRRQRWCPPHACALSEAQ